jgi:hypothetical protein
MQEFTPFVLIGSLIITALSLAASGCELLKMKERDKDIRATPFAFGASIAR